MKVTNVSNYAKVVAGVRIEPGETSQVEIEEDRLQRFRDDGKLEIEDESTSSENKKSEEEDVKDGDDESKTKENKKEDKGDE